VDQHRRHIVAMVGTNVQKRSRNTSRAPTNPE
jgi:hypothetical protein